MSPRIPAPSVRGWRWGDEKARDDPGLGTITNLAFLARRWKRRSAPTSCRRPQLTLDNEEARIIVGQNIPLVTGSYATTGNTSTVTPFQTFERKDVGLLLRVKPQITEGGRSA